MSDRSRGRSQRRRDTLVLQVGGFIITIIISGVGLSPLGTAATFGLLYKPQMIDEGDCGAIGGMKIACPSTTLSTTNPT
jgi:hypothetical protein